MTSAHIFYIPILILVGAFGGFFLGRRAAEQERLEEARRQQRKAALAEQQASKREGAQKAPAQADAASEEGA